ncbi:E3 ubiquitin-protein ligase TTC3-like [Saccoglossus kowalevskii]
MEVNKRKLATTNSGSSKMWFQDVMAYPFKRQEHEHVILIYVLSPFLFNNVHQNDKWMAWAKEWKLLPSDGDLTFHPLPQNILDTVYIIEKAFEVLCRSVKQKGQRFLKNMLDLVENLEKKQDAQNALVKAMRCSEFMIMSNELTEISDKLLEDVTGALILVSMQFYDHVIKLTQKGCNLEEEFKAQNRKNAKTSDDIRMRGNRDFKESKYTAACHTYTNAIQLDAYNERLYSNRALCYLKTGDYRKALSDGKRAIIVKPSWPKGQHRYAEALFGLEQHQDAVRANMLALSVCRENGCSATELRELETQKEKFAHKVPFRETSVNQESDDDDVPDLVDQGSSDEETEFSNANIKKTAKVNIQSLPEEVNGLPPLVDLESDVDSDSDAPSGGSLKEPLISVPHPIRRSEQKPKTKNDSKKQPIKKDFKEALCKGSEALLESRQRIAVTWYRKANDIMSTKGKDSKLLNDEFEVVVFLYAFGTALLETSQVQELEEAFEKFQCIIIEHQSMIFPLAYYGRGRAFIQQNRYLEALVPLKKGLTILSRHTNCPVLDWPGTKQIIPESEYNKMEACFKSLILLCKAPPPPDTVCRYEHCTGFYKVQIYYSDPDFKGFIHTECYDNCRIDYHPSCWKKVKGKSLDKDFIGYPCFTPDCNAVIILVRIYSQDGLVKTELTGEKPVKFKKEKTAVPPPLKTVNEKKLEKLRLKKEKKRLAKESLVKIEKSVENASNQVIVNGIDSHKRPSSLPLSTLTNNLIHSTSTSPGSPDSTKLPTNFEMGFKLEKDEEETEINGASRKVFKNKSKKKIPKVKHSLDVFFTRTDDAHSFCDAEENDDGESSSSSRNAFQLLDDNSPFTIPEHLREDTAQLETNTGTIPQAVPTVDVVANESLRETLFSYFASILDKYGPLSIDDPKLISEFNETFPSEARDLVNSCGGLSQFLLKSLQFAMVENIVCLLKDSVKCKELAMKYKKSKGDTSPVNTDYGNGLSTFKQAVCNPVPCTQYEMYHTYVDSATTCNLTIENFPALSAEISNEDAVINASTESLSDNIANDDETSKVIRDIAYIDAIPEFVPRQKSAVSQSITEPIVKSTCGLDQNAESDASFQDALCDLPTEDKTSMSQKATNYLIQSFYSQRCQQTEYNPTSSYVEAVDSGIDPGLQAEVGLSCTGMGLSEIDLRTGTSGINDFCDAVSENKTQNDNTNFCNNNEISSELENFDDAKDSIISKNKSRILPMKNSIKYKNACVQAFVCPLHNSVGVNTEPYEDTYKQLYENIIQEKHRMQMQHQAALDRFEQMKNKTSTEIQMLQKDLEDRIDMEKNQQKIIWDLKQQHDMENKQVEKDKNEVSKRFQLQISMLNEKQERHAAELNTKDEDISHLQNLLQSERDGRFAEKLNYEQDRVRAEETYKSTLKRAQDAEMMIFELKMSIEKRPLEVKRQEAEYYCRHFTNMADRPPGIMGMTSEDVIQQCKSVAALWQTFSEELQKKIAEIKTSYEERIDMVRRGQMLSSLPPINISPLPQPPAALFQNPLLKSIRVPPSFPASGVTTPPPFSISPSPPTVSATPPPGLDSVTVPSSEPATSDSAVAALTSSTNIAVPTTATVTTVGAEVAPAVSTSGLVSPAPTSKPTISAITPHNTQSHSRVKPHLTGTQQSVQQPQNVSRQMQFPTLTAQAQQVHQPKNSFEKIMSKLMAMYPVYNKVQLTNFIKDVRSANGNSLSGLSLDEIILRVSDLIASDQKRLEGLPHSVQASLSTGCGVPVIKPIPTTAPLGAAARPVVTSQMPKPIGPPMSPVMPEPSLHNIGFNLDDDVDPCVICHEELTTGATCVLECKHRFHKSCIRKWMHEQSTCPTCRVHILLAEDFPSLMTQQLSRQRLF